MRPKSKEEAKLSEIEVPLNQLKASIKANYKETRKDSTEVEDGIAGMF